MTPSPPLAPRWPARCGSVTLRTGTVASSTSERRLERKGVRFKGFEDARAALAALARGDLDAVVYDRPLLRYLVRTEFAGQLQVLSISFEPQDYAIGLRSGDPRREAINRSLLQHGRGAEWDALLLRHLGSEE